MSTRLRPGPLFGRAMWLPALIAFGFALWTARLGIDFGEHWDEKKLLNSAERAATVGVLLPGWYDYGSASFWLVLAALAPDAPAVALDRDLVRRDEKQAALGAMVRDPAFQLRARTFFLFFTYLTVVPLGALVYRWRQSRLEAVVASCAFLSMWEVQYHSRWIAPDGLMMFWATVSQCLVLAAATASTLPRARLRLGAVAVGLTIASKYPGGLMLLPLLFTAWMVYRPEGGPAARRESLRLVGLALATFVVVTPGAILEPARFLVSIAYQIQHYALKEHGPYGVQPFFEHMVRMLQYLGGVAFSHNRWVALGFSALAILGAYDVVRNENRRVAVAFLLFPAVYLLYFSAQKLMIVRNLLVLLPFLSVLVARGAGRFASLVPNPRYRAAALLVPLAGIAYNFVWLNTSARTISRPSAPDARSVAAFLDRHRNANVFVSEGVGPVPADYTGARVVASPQEADLVLFRSDEIIDNRTWTANQPGVYEIVAGSYEVNWDYYPSWIGETPVLCVRARHIGALLPYLK